MRLKAFVPYLIILSIIVCIIWLSIFYINDLLANIVISSLSITYIIVIVVFCVNLFRSEKENAKKGISQKTSENEINKEEIEAKNKEIETKNGEISKLRDKVAHLQQRIFDISESYSTKIIENLKEANNRNIFIESVLNNIRINVFSLNKEGFIVSVNNEILRNFGLKKDEVIGEKYNFFKFIEYERLKKIYEENIYENINNHEETIIIKSHKIDILKSISVVFGEENEFLGVVVSFVDVSNLKSLQRILNAINKQNQDILNNIKSGIISIGKDVIIKSQYSKFVEYLFPDREINGSTLDNFLLKNIHNLEIEDYIKSLIDIILNRKRTPVSTINGMPIVSEFPAVIIEQNGEIDIKQKYYKLNFERIFENDEITGAMLIIDDITDQKLLKENLKKEQEAHQKEIELIYNLLKVNPQICKDSIDESYKNLANMKTLIDSKDWNTNTKVDKEFLNVLTRHSHSIKGLTKMLSMSDSSNSAHQLENIFTQQRDKNDIPIKNFISQIKENLQNLEDALKKETTLANKILGIETEGNENTSESVITVEAEKLNRLLSNYNNLTLYLTRSQAIPKSLLLKLLDSIHKIKRGSIIPFVEMLNEMIKNIGKSLGKKINNIKILGNTTEIDYKVLRTLKDPIIHIIRNILDHGVEYPEVRTKKGKPEIGNITMTIKEDNTFISLIITDDGAGIDMTKLKEKANKLGLEYSNEKKLINLIFIDGFSTKDIATEISGRGVGMSVVKEAVRSLGGKLYIKSVQDKGTSIIMKMPLSIIADD